MKSVPIVKRDRCVYGYIFVGITFIFLIFNANHMVNLIIRITLTFILLKFFLQKFIPMDVKIPKAGDRLPTGYATLAQ
jgi:hypothetical protein